MWPHTMLEVGKETTAGNRGVSLEELGGSSQNLSLSWCEAGRVRCRGPFSRGRRAHSDTQLVGPFLIPGSVWSLARPPEKTRTWQRREDFSKSSKGPTSMLFAAKLFLTRESCLRIEPRQPDVLCSHSLSHGTPWHAPLHGCKRDFHKAEPVSPLNYTLSFQS